MADYVCTGRVTTKPAENVAGKTIVTVEIDREEGDSISFTSLVTLKDTGEMVAHQQAGELKPESYTTHFLAQDDQPFIFSVDFKSEEFNLTQAAFVVHQGRVINLTHGEYINLVGTEHILP